MRRGRCKTDGRESCFDAPSPSMGEGWGEGVGRWHTRSENSQTEKAYMALTELEIKRIEKAVEAFMDKHRPKPDIREQLDLGYRIVGQSIELFEIRPYWRDPAKKIENPVAKATFVRTTATWKVFWQRADLKWHSYEPAPQVGTVEKFLEIVGEDKHASFFG